MQVLAVSFTRHDTPVADNVLLSALVAALPIIVLLGLLGLLRVKAHLAALAGLVASLPVAMVVFGMPVKTAAGAATNRAAFGLFPIGWIVLCAIFVYDITVKTGRFEEVTGPGRAAALLAAQGDLALRRRPGGRGGAGCRPPPSRAGRRAQPGPGAAARSELPTRDRREAFLAWLPWILLAVLVFLWGTPQVNKETAEKAVYEFFPLSATGTALLITGILSGLALRLRPGEIGRVCLGTLRRVRFSLLTIAAMLAIGYVTRYGGLDASMGLAFARASSSAASPPASRARRATSCATCSSTRPGLPGRPPGAGPGPPVPRGGA